MKHLLSAKALSRDAAIDILDTAEQMSENAGRDTPKLPDLLGKTVVNLFYEDSTRTRVSFDVAAKRLSAEVINFAAKGSSVSKGESLKDTAQTLSAMGADAVVVRHWASGAPAVLAHNGWIDAAIVNAGDGTHEHPTQALIDAFTLRRRIHGAHASGMGLDGIRVTIVGDILHSRVARSNLWLLTTLGARVSFVAPATLLPTGIEGWPVEVSHDLDRALESAPDAVMMLRIQTERMHDAYFPNAGEYSRGWGLNDERLAKLPPSTMVMHPGPINRGLEISAGAADGERSTILEQVANGISVRMAVLHMLLSDARGGNGEQTQAGAPRS